MTTPIKNQPVYGVGLLLVQDPSMVTDSFYKLHFSVSSGRAKQRSQLRTEIKQGNRSPSLSEVDRLMWSTRHHEYKSSAVTLENLQHYIDLLNLYFSFNCFEFHALMMDRTVQGFDLARWGNDSWRAYIELACELLERRLNRKAFAIVDLQGQPGGASISVEEEFSSVENVAGCLPASSETQVFLQMVDVLLGCVQADWKNQNGFYEPGSKRARAKRELVKFMRTKLALTPDEPIVTRQQPNRELFTPSPFSVWLKS